MSAGPYRRKSMPPRHGAGALARHRTNRAKTHRPKARQARPTRLLPVKPNRMNATIRRAIYEALQSLNPHPTTELEYTTPFELLIAVMLSAQATDVGVNKA